MYDESMMRKIISAIIIIFLTTPLLFTEEERATHFFELENGLKVFLYKRGDLPLVHCVLGVNVGSKDETDETNGLIHILEHYILFRGTEFRTGEEIGADIRRHGGYYNAHTGRDLSLFEITVSSEHLEFALKNQKEIIFHLKLEPEKLEEEKQVILEELSQAEDDPVKYGTSLLYQNLFPNHPYSRPIYGKRDSIKTANVNKLREFYQSYFIPENCALALTGRFDINEAEEKVRAVFSNIKKERNTLPDYSKVQPLDKKLEIEHQMDINQAYILVGIPAPDYNSGDQFSMDILTEILGRGINPMLFSALRGRRELIHSLTMSYTAMRYGGALVITMTLYPRNVKAAQRETLNFLRSTRKQNFSKDDFYGEAQLYAFDFLEQAKNQLKFKTHQAQEHGLNIAQSMARYMLLNTQEERKSYLESIESINSSDIRKTAGEYLSRGNFVFVTILPLKEKKS
ncbi:MAG: M16 family metallopeptidase [Acidobacteriota bacterium]